MQKNAAGGGDPVAHERGEGEDVGRRRARFGGDDVGVAVADDGAADAEPLAAGLVEEPAGRDVGRVAEDGARRAEPAEVEAVLQEILQVEWVAVRAILDQQHPCLCAYYEEEPKRSVEEAIELARRRLPSYMVPSCFMKIDQIPRDTNGKIAKKYLPVPDADLRQSVNRNSGGTAGAEVRHLKSAFGEEEEPV